MLNPITLTLIALIFLLLIFGAMKLSSDLTGVWYSPLVLYLGRWLLLIFLFSLHLVPYNRVRPTTWLLIALSILMFTLGSLIPMFFLAQRTARAPLPNIRLALRAQLNRQRFQTAVLLIFAAGSLLLLYYLYSVSRTFGPTTILYEPHVVRAAIAAGNVPPGFHYFYVMELVAALAWLYFCLNGRRTAPLLILVGLIAAASLTLTTGKVNLIKTIVWAAVILLTLNLGRLRLWRIGLLSTILLIVGLSAFSLLSTWGSETLDNSIWSRYTDQTTGWRASLTSAYIYNTGQIPTLDQLLQDDAVEFQYGKLTFLPLVKLGRLINRRLAVPSHIGAYYFTPLPFNTATYLDVMYKDFGLPGMLILPFIFGFLSAHAHMRLIRGRITFWLIFLNTIFALIIFASPSAAAYLKPSYWFQIGAGFLLAYLLTQPTPQPLSLQQPQPQ